MVALLDPEWNLDGAAAAQDLQRSCGQRSRPAGGAEGTGQRSAITVAAGLADHDGAWSRCNAASRAATGGPVICCGPVTPGCTSSTRSGRPAAHRGRHPGPGGRDGEPAGGLGGQQRDVRRHRLRRPPPQGRADRTVPGGRGHRRLLRVRALADALRAPGARRAAGLRGHRQLVDRGAGSGQRGHRRRRRDGHARRRRGPRRLPGAVRAAHRRARAALGRAAGRPGRGAARAGAEAGGAAHRQAAAAGAAVGGVQAGLRAVPVDRRRGRRRP